MERVVGTVSMGLRAPIIREGDDLVKMAVDVLKQGEAAGDFKVRDRDVLCLTESIVGRAQGNYATTDQIAKDIRQKLGGDTVGAVFPIFSRNRFAIVLRGIARSCKKVVLLLSYPSDEVGNALLDEETFDNSGVDPYKDLLTKEEFEAKFGPSKHIFTGVNYLQYYSELVAEEGAECEIVLSNNPGDILKYTNNVLVCDIHTRKRTKRLIREAAEKEGSASSLRLFGTDEILTESVDGSGFNPDYGLLGTNKSTENKVKLFPRGCTALALEIQAAVEKEFGKKIEVMVYGDGAFKDPVGKIWECADPVVSPGYTPGLEGTPNEIKLKYLADNDFGKLAGEELKDAIKGYIAKKDSVLKDSKENAMVAQGTTPRRLTDLIGSLCDLTSGSGDKGTPIVYVQGYFDNYTA